MSDSATDNDKNVEMFKIRKLIKSLQAARGYAQILARNRLGAGLLIFLLAMEQA